MKLQAKESVYIFLACIFYVAIASIPSLASIFAPIGCALRSEASFYFFSLFSQTVFAVFLFIYIYKLKAYQAKKAIILTVFSSLFRFISYSLFISIFIYFELLSPVWRSYQAFYALLNILLSMILATFMAYIVTKKFEKLRRIINSSDDLQTTLAFGAAFTYSSIMGINYVRLFTLGTNIEFWIYIVIFCYIGFSILSFFTYVRYKNERWNLEQRTIEYSQLQFYLNEVEQQQNAIRKFRHDLHNILVAMDIYIKNDDWDGLKKYYPKVRDVSKLITKNEFELGELSKIKVPDLKNIILAKVVMAQNLKLDVKLDIWEEIDNVQVDTIVLVRILGIILDNAIEELQSLGGGTLRIACLRVEDSINLVIQNTCRPDMPPIRILNQVGFSTKGKERGFGLNNLEELTDSLQNVVLITSVEERIFTQTLIIEEGVTNVKHNDL